MRNRFDRHRIVNKPAARSGIQSLLNGGGLYRRRAIEDAGGYAANRNLLAFEEAELGLRLGTRGWRLVRLPIPYVRHTGHAMNTVGVIRRMWVSGRMAAGGVLLRSALGQPWLLRAIRMFIHPLGVMLFWVVFAALAGFAWPPGGVIALLEGAAAVFALLAVRKRSLGDALFSVVLWHLAAVGTLRGLTQRLTPPPQPIRSEVVFSPQVHTSVKGT